MAELLVRLSLAGTNTAPRPGRLNFSRATAGLVT